MCRPIDGVDALNNYTVLQSSLHHGSQTAADPATATTTTTTTTTSLGFCWSEVLLPARPHCTAAASRSGYSARFPERSDRH